MLKEKFDDKKILKDIFSKSLELADPAKKIETIKFDPPLGTLFSQLSERVQEDWQKLLRKLIRGKQMG